MFTTDNNLALKPDQVEQLLVTPALEQSTAAQVATTLRTDKHRVRFPRLASDPTAHWTGEGQEIEVSDPTFDEVTAETAKVAGMTIVSNEMMADGEPAAINQIGAGLTRQITNSIDQAFFTQVAEPAPQGLASIQPSELDVGAQLDNLDAFAEAIALASNQNSVITTFVANPADALELALLKESTGSNRGLLQADPAQPTTTIISGVPVLTSNHVPAGTIWALPKTSVHLIVRKQAEVQADNSVLFTSDRTAIRGVMRVGFAFTQPDGIVRITHGSQVES